MLKIYYKQHNIITIHVDYEQRNQATEFADYLDNNFLVSIQEIRFLFTSKTAVLIGIKTFNTPSEDVLLTIYKTVYEQYSKAN